MTCAGNIRRYAVRQVDSWMRAISPASSGRAGRTKPRAMPAAYRRLSAGRRSPSAARSARAARGRSRPATLSHPSSSVLVGGRTRLPLRRPGPADRAGRPGLHRPRPGRRRPTAPPAPGAAPAAPDPDRLGQRAAAGPLPAARTAGSGPTRPALLDRAAYRGPGELFEYWGHEASLIPVELQPLLRWRMAERQEHAWGGMRADRRASSPSWSPGCSTRCRDRGPITAAEIEQDVPRRDGQLGLELVGGQAGAGVAVLTARSPPPGATPRSPGATTCPSGCCPRRCSPRRPRAARRRSGPWSSSRPAALGVAAETELRDYFRLPVAGFKQAVAELVEDGVLRAGRRSRAGSSPAYLHPDARLPRRVRAATLVSPFDPLIWERARTERLFDFHYRIEIYVPARRSGVHGYYVLPFLLGDRLVARVDLKADRKAGVLRVPGGLDRAGRQTRRRRPRRSRSSCAGWPAGSGLERSRRRSAATWRGPLAAALAARGRCTVTPVSQRDPPAQSSRHASAHRSPAPRRQPASGSRRTWRPSPTGSPAFVAPARTRGSPRWAAPAAMLGLLRRRASATCCSATRPTAARGPRRPAWSS